MVKRFKGSDEKQDYFKEVSEVPGGAMSPGGSAQLLKVSRQRIMQIIETPEVRAWAYYTSSTNPRAAMVEVAVRDLLAYGIRRGLLNGPTDIGLSFPGMEEELASVKQNV